MGAMSFLFFSLLLKLLWIKCHKNKLFLNISVKICLSYPWCLTFITWFPRRSLSPPPSPPLPLPSLSLNKSVCFNCCFSKHHMNRFGLLSPKCRKPSDHCKCPKNTVHVLKRHECPLTERIESLNTRGMQKGAVDLNVWGRKKNTKNALKPPNPSKDCAKSPRDTKKAENNLCIHDSLLEAWCFFFFSHQLLCPHTHTHARRHARNIQKRTSVITALPVAASSFPQRAKKKKKKRKKKKGEKDPECSSETRVVLAVQLGGGGTASVRWLTNVLTTPSVWQVRVWEVKVSSSIIFLSSSGLVCPQDVQIHPSLYVFIHCSEWAEESTQSGPDAVS